MVFVTDELTSCGLMEGTKVKDTVEDSKIGEIPIGSITGKGLDILEKLGIDSPVPLKLGGFNLVLNIGSGSVKFHQEKTVTTQDIRMVFEHIKEKIDSSTTSETDKVEAKSKMKEFLEHPMVNTIVGTALGGLF